jgi:hypothetical protein
MRMKLACLLFGHRWEERKPHRMFDINDYDCSRCGAYKRQGLYS